MQPNPYDPPATQLGDSPGRTADGDDGDALETPTLAYTASGNLEAHSVVNWLRSNGMRAYAVEDNSGVSLFAFGTISQFHKPQVFVDKSDLDPAGVLLQQFEAQRDKRQAELIGSPPIDSVCEECGTASEFPASQNGTTQNCPNCNGFMDVGEIDWPDDFDFGDADEAQAPDISFDVVLDAAARLDKLGDWLASISSYRSIADRWPEHANYAANCISAIQRKIDATNGE